VCTYNILILCTNEISYIILLYTSTNCASTVDLAVTRSLGGGIENIISSRGLHNNHGYRLSVYLSEGVIYAPFDRVEIAGGWNERGRNDYLAAWTAEAVLTTKGR